MPPPDKARRLRALAVALWAVAMVVLLARAYVQPSRNTVYPIFATAAREWCQGVDIYDMTIARGHNERFRYAPLIAVAMTPFASLPDPLGGVLWRMFNMTVFVAGGIAFARAVFPGSSRLDPKATAVLALLLLPLTVGSMNNGQANILVAGCLLGATAALARERILLAAVCLAVAILFKVYPLSVAALLMLVQPRLGWRLCLILAAGCLAPFAFQDSAFVAGSYESWINQLAADNRHDYPVENGYRDFYALTRLVGCPMAEASYLVLQLGMAGLVAAVVLRGHWQGWSATRHLRAAFELGCAWIILFGPATENCTYVLLAPTMSLAAWETLQENQRPWMHWLAWTAVAVLVGGAVSASMPWGKSVSCVGMPLGGLLVFTQRLLCYCAGPRHEGAVCGYLQPSARAAQAPSPT